MAHVDGTETVEQKHRDPVTGKVSTRTVTESKRCGAELTMAEHYEGMGHVSGFEGRVHVLRCPDCGKTHGVCPVCTGEDSAPGWYRGESTGEMLACHVCNQREYARQRRER